MINTRVRPTSHVLITAARNVAVVALLDKLTRSPALARQVVVIGSERRLGAEAAPFLLPRLLQAPSDPADCAWPHLAFLVYLALASLHAAARDAHAHVRPQTSFVMQTQAHRPVPDVPSHCFLGSCTEATLCCVLCECVLLVENLLVCDTIPNVNLRARMLGVVGLPPSVNRYPMHAYPSKQRLMSERCWRYRDQRSPLVQLRLAHGPRSCCTAASIPMLHAPSRLTTTYVFKWDLYGQDIAHPCSDLL